ncbi:MAG: sulfotransferase [Deltaproteobacteria bacterium]|nr:MAG: sulfotransferase [Deltaproteobacteria bacterium]
MIGFDVQPLPLFLRVPNAVTAGLGIGAPTLTPEQLTAAAAKKAGLPARFEAHVGDALEQLCRSYADEARLHWFGRMNVWNLLVTGLAQLLLVDQAFRDDPTLHDQPLNAPLVVTGLPRSGTTFLHRLLSAPDVARGVALYEHVHPVVRGRRDLRRLDVHAMFEPWKRASRVYGLDAIHFVRPDMPDECNFGMRLAGRSMIYWATAPTYAYLDWLLEHDLRESYQLYRRVLQLHQRRHPEQRLTLKCPHHLAWLPALVEALPEAHVVQTHRDPLQTVPSEAKLILSLQGLATHELDWQRTVDANSMKAKTFADRAVAFASDPEGRRVLHVDYKALVKDPVRLSAQIHGHFGLAFAEEDRTATEAFFAENRQHKHGKNRYSLEQFGLDAAELERSFASYRETFLEREQPLFAVA